MRIAAPATTRTSKNPATIRAQRGRMAAVEGFIVLKSAGVDRGDDYRAGAQIVQLIHHPMSGVGVDHRTDGHPPIGDRKSTRLNSSHVAISYAVFCLKKKKEKKLRRQMYY